MSKKQTNKPHPFLKWAGGKRQLLPQLMQYLPETSFHRYIEPFLGAGAMFFSLSDRAIDFILSDINPDLISCYRTIRDRGEEVVEELVKLQSEYLSSNEDRRKTLYETFRNEFNREPVGKASPSVRRVALLIFLNRTCYNGLYRLNKSGKFNTPHGRYKNPTICDADNLQAVSDILQKTQLHQCRYEDFLTEAKPGTFFYLDPPYIPINSTAKFTNYYVDGFTFQNHVELARFCRAIDAKGAYFLLSNSDPGDSVSDRLYEGFYIDRVRARRNINSNKNKRQSIFEVVVRNYPCF